MSNEYVSCTTSVAVADNSALAGALLNSRTGNTINAATAIISGSAPTATSYDVDLSALAGAATRVQVVIFNHSTTTGETLDVTSDDQTGTIGPEILPAADGIPVLIYSMDPSGANAAVINLQSGGSSAVKFTVIAYAVA